jgi:hypothetical protein
MGMIDAPGAYIIEFRGMNSARKPHQESPRFELVAFVHGRDAFAGIV